MGVSIHQSFYLSNTISISLPNAIYLLLYISISIYLYTQLSLSLYMYLSISLCTYLSISLYMYPYRSLYTYLLLVQRKVEIFLACDMKSLWLLTGLKWDIFHRNSEFCFYCTATGHTVLCSNLPPHESLSNYFGIKKENIIICALHAKIQ